MKIHFILPLLFVAVFANAQQIILSDSAQISLLTAEPSPPVYARWGHTAIRVLDKKNKIDWAYNYGIFDFSDYVRFITKFVKGATDYKLDVWSTNSFFYAYSERKSSVYEQILDLTKAEKQQLFDALQVNFQPENRIYRYNFVYDNCATRPFDMIIKILHTTPIINYSHKTTTYRTIFIEGVGNNTWDRFGIDLLIGRDADKPIRQDTIIYALRAFPSYTAAILNSITLENDSISKPLVLETQKVIDFPLQKPQENGIFSPNVVCCIILALIVLLSLWGWRKKFDFVLLDFILFLISGIIGTVIFYLIFFSTHPLVENNFNLLWLNPLQLIFAFLLIKESWRRPLSYFALFNTFTTLLAIIVWVTRYQVMHPAFLPLMAIYLMRSILFFQNNFKKIHYNISNN